MEGTLGEIKAFGGSFAPRNWTFCQGQLIPISQNQALYAVLGVTYGGDGRMNFGLPDLRGRVPVGWGAGPGLRQYGLGQKAGSNQFQLGLAHLPTHNHGATPNLSVSGNATGNVLPKCYNEIGEASSPSNNVPANVGSGYMTGNESDATMAPIDVDLTVQGTVQGHIAIEDIGGGQPLEHMPPVIGMNWIICTAGLFPSRN